MAKKIVKKTAKKVVQKQAGKKPVKKAAPKPAPKPAKKVQAKKAKSKPAVPSKQAKKTAPKPAPKKVEKTAPAPKPAATQAPKTPAVQDQAPKRVRKGRNPSPYRSLRKWTLPRLEDLAKSSGAETAKDLIKAVRQAEKVKDQTTPKVEAKAPRAPKKVEKPEDTSTRVAPDNARKILTSIAKSASLKVRSEQAAAEPSPEVTVTPPKKLRILPRPNPES